ncbi:MAG: sulfur carrier protein ThiS [Candidatus Sumerlaeota bacterium]
MHIVVNDKNLETSNEATVDLLIEELDLTGRKLAVMVDGEVVRKADFAATRLTEGCKVEIISMVGGG